MPFDGTTEKDIHAGRRAMAIEVLRTGPSHPLWAGGFRFDYSDPCRCLIGMVRLWAGVDCGYQEAGAWLGLTPDQSYAVLCAAPLTLDIELQDVTPGAVADLLERAVPDLISVTT